MAYTPTNWVNDSAPAINATNLNNIETGIDEAHDDLDAATDAATAGELVRRDGSGRAKVATPSASGDIATKGYVDGLASNYATAAQGALADSAVQPSDAASTSAAGVVELATSGETTTGTDTTRAVTPSGLAATSVPKSLVDAKGDLLVGTADNTVGRLPAGTDGQTIVYDSGEATGLRPADFPSGGGGVPDLEGWRVPLIGRTGTRIMQAGWMVSVPVAILQDMTVTSISFNVTTAGASASSVILGLYSMSTPGGVGTLVHTFGEADTTTTGLKTFTGSWSIPAGAYYVSLLNKGNAPTTDASNGTAPGLALCIPLDSEVYSGKRYLSNNGATSLPGTTGTLSPNGSAGGDYLPSVWVVTA